MKIVQICNNYACQDDGIGSYVSKLVHELEAAHEIEVVSGRCPAASSLFARVTSFSMSEEIHRLLESGRLTEVDVVVVDYPFIEVNPAVLVSLYKLKKNLNVEKIPLVLSLHEYARSRGLRKMLSRSIARLADAALVTTEEDAAALKRICPNIYYRDIPSNISIDVSNINDYTRNGYVYFGIVNRAKAFDNLVSAWALASLPNETLRIVTSSDVENRLTGVNGIDYRHDASDGVVADCLCKSRWCILPIKPKVDRRNTTFIAAMSAGCVCIGAFTEEFAHLPFVVDVPNYEPRVLAEAITSVTRMSEEDLEEKSRAAQEFSCRYAISEVASKYIEALRYVCETYGKVRK